MRALIFIKWGVTMILAAFMKVDAIHEYLSLSIDDVG